MISSKTPNSLWNNSLLLVNHKSDARVLITYNYLHVRNIAASFLAFNNKPDDHHFFHGLSFYTDIKSLGFQLVPINILNIDQEIKDLDLAIFFDYTFSTKSQLERIRSINNKVKIVLSLVENPAYLTNSSEEIFSKFDEIYSAYNIGYNYIKTETAYIYKSIPCHLSIHSEYNSDFLESSFDSSIINSNLHSFSFESQYSLRKRLINICSNIENFNFRWYGRGWFLNNIEKIRRKNLRYTKADILSSVKLSQNAKKKYHGEIKNKSLLTRCKSTFAIENLSSPINYYTEKIFEPLEYCCVPIFLKTPNLDNGLLSALETSEYSQFICQNPLKMLKIALELSDLDLKETQSAAFNMRNFINTYIKENDFNTNLYNCFQAVRDFS